MINIFTVFILILMITACTLVLNTGTLEKSPNAGVVANDNIMKGEK